MGREKAVFQFGRRGFASELLWEGGHLIFGPAVNHSPLRFEFIPIARKEVSYGFKTNSDCLISFSQTW